MLSVGSIVSGAFGLVRDRFGSVLVWGLLYSIAAFALGYFIMAWMQPMMAVDENTDLNVALGALGNFFAQLILLYLLFLVLYCVLLTAAQRAVLRPEESGFAYLRLGADELRQIGLSIFLGIVFSVVYLVATLILGIIAIAVGGVGAGAGGAGAETGFGLGMILGVIAVLCLMLYLWVRVSLAFPLTLLRRRFVLGEAWRLSRGRFWTLLGGYLVLMITVIVISILVSLLVQGDYWAQMIGGDFMDPATQEAMQAEMEAQYSFGPQMVLSLVLGAVIGGLMIALTGGGLASAARALEVDHEGMAKTFS